MPACVAGGVPREKQLTLADVTEPNVGQGAGAPAVNTLELTTADDNLRRDEQRLAQASVRYKILKKSPTLLMLAPFSRIKTAD